MNRIVWRKGGKKETRGKIRVIGLERFFFFFFFFGGRTSQWKVIGCKWEGEGGYWVLDKWVNKWILPG